MPIAALYDIHGNLPALEAVLEEIEREGVERIVIGGDVTLGPMPRETLALLRGLDVSVEYLRGNCDTAVLAQMTGGDPGKSVPEQAREGVRWTARQLDPADAQVFAGWPPTVRATIPELGEVLFCHATPRDEKEIFTRETAEEVLLPIFADLDVALAVCGHTHMQFEREIGGVRILNAGSVGMPFGAPGAYWLLLGPTVEHRRTGYDLEAAAKRVRATGHPQAEDLATGVLQPKTEREILDLFSKVALR